MESFLLANFSATAIDVEGKYFVQSVPLTEFV